MITNYNIQKIEGMTEWLEAVPYDVTRDSLYAAADLYGEYDESASLDECYDSRVYEHYLKMGKNARDVRESLARTLHDHGIHMALDAFFEEHDSRLCVGIMGGHALQRSDPMFANIVLLSKRLTEEGFHFMLPTAETALINLYRGEILNESDLPKRLFAYTPCYRREAGTYRASERGMIRGHQFNKVEMFGYTRPEDSDAMLKELIGKACRLVEGLGLHYRLSKLAAGDCSASMATTYDIELWIPSMNEYKECSSVSNARDYQARRGNIRFRREETKKIEFVHTLNGSGLATSRLIPAIVEQYQQPDGSVIVPEALRPFYGEDKITK